MEDIQQLTYLKERNLVFKDVSGVELEEFIFEFVQLDAVSSGQHEFLDSVEVSLEVSHEEIGDSGGTSGSTVLTVD
jgi:hypothetical protein